MGVRTLEVSLQLQGLHLDLAHSLRAHARTQQRQRTGKQHSAIGQEREGAKGGPRFSVTRTKAVDVVLLADSKPFCKAKALPLQVPFLT